MRDSLGAVGGQGDELQQAEVALGAVGGERLAPEWREGLLRGRFGEAVMKMLVCAHLEAGRGGSRPGQARGAGLDFVAEIGEVECRLEAVMLDGELVWLVDNDRSTVRHSAAGERAAMAREIVARVSGRIGEPSGRDGQVVALVWDPMGAVACHGGLEEALEELGKRCTWLSAVALASDERLEIHDVPGSANPLDRRVREGMLRMHDRRLLEASAGHRRE